MNRIKIMIIASSCLLMLTGEVLADLEWRVEKPYTLTAGVRDVVEAPDGKRLYVLTEQGAVLVLDQKGQVEATIPGPFTADRLSVGKDGKKLYLGGMGQKSLQVVSLVDRYQIDVAGSPFKGDAAAAVTVVVFSDFQWPYCARVNPLLDQLVEKYPSQVKVVFKNFPLRNHKMASPAAQAALAAHMQNQFWAYHDKVFVNFSSLNESKLAEFATEVGLDLVKFNQDRTSSRVKKQISDDLRLGQVVGVRGTPTVFINGMLLKNRNLAGASQMIDAELKRRGGK